MAEIANLKCPYCGEVQGIEVPKEKCLAFHICSECGRLIKAPKGSCCVICAYSDRKCGVSIK